MRQFAPAVIESDHAKVQVEPNMLGLDRVRGVFTPCDAHNEILEPRRR
eukprot:COSAG02_NODE_56051_length_287_cov_0.909574_1_plen_47_part_01